MLPSHPDLPLLGYKEPTQITDIFNKADDNFNTEAHIVKLQKRFNQVEEEISQNTYHYINWWGYKTCKDHHKVESISIRKELKQDMNNHLVTTALPTFKSTKG